MLRLPRVLLLRDNLLRNEGQSEKPQGKERGTSVTLTVEEQCSSRSPLFKRDIIFIKPS